MDVERAEQATPGPRQLQLVAALVMVQVLFGGIAVAGKLVLPHVDALALALCRLGAAALVLLLLERLLVRSRMPPMVDLARFALYGLLGVVLNQTLFLSGLERTTATNAVLLIATIPAFTLLVAVLMRHERTHAWQIGGLAISFAGVAVLVVGSLDLGIDTVVGNLMVLANALSYSAYLVLSKPALARYDPLTVIAWVFVFGFFEMTLFAWPSFLATDWGNLTPTAWGAFAYIILGATIVTYGLNNWVLRHSAASHVANYVYLQPVVGAFLAWLILEEPLTRRVLGGGALILLGVFLATQQFTSRRAGKPF